MRNFTQKPDAARNTSVAKSTPAFTAQRREAVPTLHLQRAFGNQAVLRLLHANAGEPASGPAAAASAPPGHDFSRIPLHAKVRPEIQPDLTVGAPGDLYEQEADRIADEVLRMPERKPPETNIFSAGFPKRRLEEDRDNGTPVQAKADADRISRPVPGFQSVMETINGIPLSEKERTFFEPRFGFDFSRVRIHTDSNAAQTSKALGARAFTHGPDIYFNAGAYDTGSEGGYRLIAHELTHVVQQTGGHGRYTENLSCRIARAPERTIQRAIQNVQQAELATFFSQPEPGLPQELLDKYLLDTALMSTQRGIIRAMVHRIQAGEAPLTADELLALVLERESDRGTALIICHNITKALARGESPINWSNVSRDPLVYSLNGTTYTFDQASFHPDAIGLSSRNQASVFYAMLSPNDFETRDEGDWYHYFAMAAVSYYGASRRLRQDETAQQEFRIQFTGGLVRRVTDALRDTSITGAAYEGWLMANAMSFLEGAHYGMSQDEVNEESNVHIRGASRGLEVVGRIPEENWKWYVPRTGSISPEDLSEFEFRDNMVASIRAGIDGNFTITIMSGTTPDYWLDTPDPYVRTPGFFGGRTTTKDNTTSPVWNEVIGTYSHDSLASFTLQLYDEDMVFNDSIVDFTDDLRPRGRRSRDFSLTSGGSTLEVRVEAAGTVVLASP